MISILMEPGLAYPDATDSFSPDQLFPEYRFDSVSTKPNAVYGAIRRLFIQAGLDSERLGTADWNPLGQFARPGDRVFLLCNFMQERRRNESIDDFRGRCSHGSVIRALVDYLLIAVGESGSVSIGNAPIQFCDWDAVLADTEVDRVLDFYQSLDQPVQAKDLRLVVTSATPLGSIKGVERRAADDGVGVPIDEDSLLTELDVGDSTRYRVMNYDPRRTTSFHSGGRHEYVLNRHILESDVIVSAPKLKTHEKTGITCAIKGTVGAVAHKDSLPHHRYGSPEVGGDEYPANPSTLTVLSSTLHERVQHTRPDSISGSLMRAVYKIYRRLIRRWSPVFDGAWCGNDTTWRMVADVARAVTYADVSGTLHDSPQRRHVILTDGVIGGEGEGPYYSTAVHTGALALSDDLWAADYANALLMGFEPKTIPLVRETAHLGRYPLAPQGALDSPVVFNGRAMTLRELGTVPMARYEPHDAWKDAL